MYTGITVGCVTTIGNKHIKREVPCEDASFASQRDGVSVVCIADGAGGKRYTHARFGSACAVKAIADILTDHFDALYNENREAAVRSYLMARLRIEFANIINEQKLDSLDQLSCTLLFAAVKDRRMMIGHLGDGLIARITPSGIVPFTMPQNEKDGTTFFITAGPASDYMRFIKTTVDDCHAIALMTDGVQDSVYDEDAGLVKPVVGKMAETFSEGREKGEEAIKEILEKFIVGSSNVSDDSSFGVLLFEGTKAPDLGSLPASADKFGVSDETFKDIASEIKDDLIKASEIIKNAASRAKAQEDAGQEPEEKSEEESKETDVQDKEADNQDFEEKDDKKDIETETENIKTEGNKSTAAIILGIVAAIEFIVIVLLLLF